MNRDECHALLDQLPEEGLSELGETLQEMVRLYNEKASYVPAPTPEITRIPVTLSREYVRPEFPIEMDDA